MPSRKRGYEHVDYDCAGTTLTTYESSAYAGAGTRPLKTSSAASKSKLLAALDGLNDPSYKPYSAPKLPPNPKLKTIAQPMPGYEYVLPPKPESHEPPKKRAKKAKAIESAADEPPAPGSSQGQEKRVARYKKVPPKNILDRVERVLYQRFFMVDRQREGDELKEKFSVLGSTGNVYTVVIHHLPSCDCPDAQKGNHCKHILFIFLKVLQVPQSSPHWYQKALLITELEEIFRDAPAAPNANANNRVRDAFAEATGRSSPSKETAVEKSNKKIPTEEDDCPVCYEGMHGSGASKLVWCEECGNALHKECFDQWRKSGRSVTCVYCRAPWAAAGPGGKGKGRAIYSEGYLNLSSVAGVNRERDTSTYYQGPRRGQRYYGYQDYGFADLD